MPKKMLKPTSQMMPMPMLAATPPKPTMADVLMNVAA